MSSQNLAGICQVTRAMVHERARELALITGRGPQLVTQAHYERAKRELTGQSDMGRQDAILDSLPKEKRWYLVPGSASHRVPESPSKDDDPKGRSDTDQLVEEGAEEAGLEQMLQAAIADEEKSGRAP